MIFTINERETVSLDNSGKIPNNVVVELQIWSKSYQSHVSVHISPGCCHLPTPPRFGMLGPEIVLQGTRYAEIFRV
ncbi:hypothetical protein NC651_031533 [Populus alba x Populus x berolinensis]|nr:hypothetical protein NC651_031533 [Populus alba x Populus x berolinensis]